MYCFFQEHREQTGQKSHTLLIYKTIFVPEVAPGAFPKALICSRKHGNTRKIIASQSKTMFQSPVSVVHSHQSLREQVHQNPPINSDECLSLKYTGNHQ
jgi:hypothetical protein